MKLYEYVIQARDKFSDTFKKLNDAAGVGDKKVEGVKKRLDSAAKSSDGFGNALTNLKRTIATTFAIGAIIAFTGKIANAGIQFEQTKISFETMLGSAEKAHKVLGDLNEFANVTPFTNEEVIKSGQNLLAFGTKAEDLMGKLKTIGDVASGLNTPFTELAAVFGKIEVSGLVQGEDLNQLAGKGIPIFEELAKVMGVSAGEIRKLGAQGKISTDIMTKAFENMTSEGGMFFNMMEKQSKTVGGRISTLQGKLGTLAKDIGTAMLPAIGVFVDMALWMVENTELLKTLGIGVGIVAGSFLAYKLVIFATNSALAIYRTYTIAARMATILFAGGFAKLNLIMSLNPVGLIVAGIVALIAAVIVAYNKFETFRGIIWGFFEAFKEVFKSIGDIATNIFGGIIKMISGVFTGNFDKAKEGLKDLGKGLLASNPVGFAATYGKNIADAAVSGFESGKDKKLSLGGMFDSSAPAGAATGGDMSFAPAGGDMSTTGSGIDNITGGGGRVMNVTVNLGKFLDNIVINQNTSEALDDIEDRFKEMFARILNGAVYATN